ncbi:DUF2958 domain-containing protein [Sphingobium phenoxybenzoativorans]|uniref:DUF2958 domain-containing protein n=1 Tax=Sphingobium phenoxybenzoativorans TaxID=1592790 RepID=UPI000872D80F|nr:DUF2958 domain-containing protein [Sphingobium phenoxybenzoativorans]
MTLLTAALRYGLRANAISAEIAREQGRAFDPCPLVKLYSPLSTATWLVTELARDGDSLFGLADLGLGYAELGTFSLRHLCAMRLPHGHGIECEAGFATIHPLSVWTQWARCSGSVLWTEILLTRAAAAITASDPEIPG